MMNVRRDLPLAMVLVAIGVLGRWVDHAPNATPVAAAALLAGYALGSRRLAVLVPLLTLGLSDVLFRGGYNPQVMLSVYGTMALLAWVGPWLRGRWHAARVLGASLTASLLFYALTNLAVWWTGWGYEPTLAGLGRCYVNALPFLRNTLQGDLSWCVTLFGTMAALEWLTASRRPLVRASEPTPAIVN